MANLRDILVPKPKKDDDKKGKKGAKTSDKK